MRSLILALALAIAPALGLAVGGDAYPLRDADIDLTDQESLQRGGEHFVNYCMGCHSLKYMRYNRMAEDIGLDEAELRQEYMFNDAAKPGDRMTNAMRPEDGEQWFGTAVPDLTLVTRWRSPDWVYTYLKSFYLDADHTFGYNNAVFPNVGMPHVLASLQGVQEAVFAPAKGDEEHGPIEELKLLEAGLLSPEEFDTMVRDLTNFLTYVGEPMRLERRRLGVYVILFLGVFVYFAYLLKKEYWKDVSFEDNAKKPPTVFSHIRKAVLARIRPGTSERQGTT